MTTSITTQRNRYRQIVVTFTATIITHPLNIEKSAKEEKRQDITIDLKPGKPSYDHIVDTIVSRLYPNPKMQAVVNNYLLDPTNNITLDEFNVMQEVRKQAKTIAKEVLQSIEQ